MREGPRTKTKERKISELPKPQNGAAAGKRARSRWPPGIGVIVDHTFTHGCGDQGEWPILGPILAFALSLQNGGMAFSGMQVLLHINFKHMQTDDAASHISRMKSVRAP
ncbi:hypothetical protein [Rhizobium mongolense]|uniref:hypothetical protein n=1 Tax=Rhizobium mongolense TaxID=57676 RepID=UPI00160E3A2D|nr:hypothetical protein [Rhizobium mongolense]